MAPDGPASGATQTVFVGTTREEGSEGFGFGRSDVTSFLSYDVGLPSDRAPGEVNWPPKSRKPDPARDFLTVDVRRFPTDRDFRLALAARIRQSGERTVVIYVHGFNNTMAESVYRVAQMHHDLKVPAVAVHYAWPSRASALGYVHDQQSVLFARSGFVDLIDVVSAAGATKIYIVAHSMGSVVTMEGLRQMALGDRSRALGPLSGVILIAPDLDLDVFRSQARDIGELPQPFVIFGSSRDRILDLSARISGQSDRLGNLDSIDEVADLDLTYVDTAAYNTGTGHLNLATSPALLSLFSGINDVNAALQADERSRVGLLPGLILTVRNATEIVLAPVEAVATGQ
jgi:esterase/lipase superfamily enzyme